MKYRKEPHIIQRQGKNGWTFMVRIRTDNGEICKSFNEKDYPSSKIAFETAINFRNKMEYELTYGLAEKENNSTVQEMFDEYIENCPSSLKTKKHLTKLYNKYVSHKEKRIQDLTKYDIICDLNNMVETSTDDTIQRVFFIYKECIVGTALLKDILKRDTCIGIKQPKSKFISKKKDVTTDRETLEKVKKGLMRIPNHYNARIICYLLDVIYYTGMRPAEAEVLTRDDITPTHISISKQLGSNKDEDNVPTKCKTDDSVRLIPIHPNLRPILNELLEYSKYDNLFAKEDGSYMDSTWIGNLIRRICQREKIEFNMYRLRHNLATELITNKVDDRTTMELLGHANYNMSLYYATSSDELKEDAIGLIS